MDFKNFTVQKTSNSVIDTEIKEEVKLGKGLANHFGDQEIYQGCSGSCKTETTHYVKEDSVVCKYCGYTYKLEKR